MKEIFRLTLILGALKFSIQNQPLKPLKIAVITRNGVSTPKSHLYDELAFSSHLNEDMLLPSGERMMMNLGLKIKEMYPNLMQKTDSISMYSSQRKNAMMSTLSLYSGLTYHLQAKQTSSNIDNSLLNPPLSNLTYQFSHQNALPNSLSVPFLTSANPLHFDEPFFSEDLHEKCPDVFRDFLNSSKSSAFDEEFDDLRTMLRNAGVFPEGDRASNGWDRDNLVELFNAAESHLYETKKHLTGITEEIYNKLWLFKSYVIETENFGELVPMSRIWTNNILNDTLKFFKSNQTGRDVRVYSTDGDQLYAFLRLFGFSKKECLLKINNGTEAYPYPIGAKKELNSESCYLYPQFGSSLIFEHSLNETTNITHIRVIYNGESINLGCTDQREDFFCEESPFSNLMHFSLFGFDFLPYCKGRGIPIFEEVRNYRSEEKEYKILTAAVCILMFLFGMILLCTRCRYSDREIENIDEKLNSLGLAQKNKKNEDFGEEKGHTHLRRRKSKSQNNENTGQNYPFGEVNKEQNKLNISRDSEKKTEPRKDAVNLSFDEDEDNKEEFQFDEI